MRGTLKRMTVFVRFRAGCGLFGPKNMNHVAWKNAHREVAASSVTRQPSSSTAMGDGRMLMIFTCKQREWLSGTKI